MDPFSHLALLGWFTLHIGALAAAWGTRLAAGSRLEWLVQLSFFVAMAAVGASAWVGHRLELGMGLPSAITLMLMVLTAVVDCRRSQETTPATRSATAS